MIDLEFLNYGFNQRALLFALLVGFSNGYLSAYVVLRQQSLFTGALSHTLFPGIALGALLFGLNPLSGFFGALLAAIVFGLAASSIARNSRVDADTVMAVLFTLAFALGLLLLSRSNINVRLEDYLVGNILALDTFDLWFSYGVTALILTFLIIFQRPLLLMMFESNVAASQGVPVKALNYCLTLLVILAMVTSLRAVGTILALGLLVAPAAIMYLWIDNPRTLAWGSGILGMAVCILAIVLANFIQFHAGGLIILILGGLFLLSFVFSPKYGLARRWATAHHTHHHS